MGKTIAIIVLVVLLVFFALFHFGIIKIGIGSGRGNGAGNSEKSIAEEFQETEEVIIDENPELTIVVDKATYKINDKQVDISEIKNRIEDFAGRIIIESNYATLSVWESLKRELNEMKITFEEIL